MHGADGSCIKTPEAAGGFFLSVSSDEDDISDELWRDGLIARSKKPGSRHPDGSPSQSSCGYIDILLEFPHEQSRTLLYESTPDGCVGNNPARGE